MIFRDAVRSLKKDFSRTFFYWLTFFVTSMFMFLFFNISMSDEIGVTFINSKNDVSTNVTIFVIILSSIDIMFANNFFIKKKAKHLAVMLVSGATYLQLAAYLLIQTFILLLIAIPLGIICVLILIPLINSYLASGLSSAFRVTVHFEAVVSTAIVLVYVIFWATLLNLSFAYRNSASLMMNESSISLKAGEPFFRIAGISKKVKKILHIVLFLAPFICFYWNYNTILLMSVISLAGMVMCIRTWFLPLVNKLIYEKKMDNPIDLIVYGFFRNDLTLMKSNYILLLVGSILLVSFLIDINGQPLETMLVLLSYIVMNVLQSMAIMFRYATEISGRTKFFKSIQNIGYMEEDVKKIILKESLLFYGFVLLLGSLYLVNTFVSLLIAKEIQFSFAFMLYMLFVIPLAVSCLINYIYYRKSILA